MLFKYMHTLLFTQNVYLFLNIYVKYKYLFWTVSIQEYFKKVVKCIFQYFDQSWCLRTKNGTTVKITNINTILIAK